MELKHAIIPFKVKQEDVSDDSGLFEGYGSIFGNIDLGGDIVVGGAFTKSLAAWSKKGQLPQLLGFHKNNNVVGDWLEMEEDSTGLRVKGQLWVKAERRIEEAVKVHNILRGTGPKGLSIGYLIKDQEIEEFEGGAVTKLKELELFEVSIAPFAMNPQASVTAVKMIDPEGRLLSKREVEKVLRDAKLSHRQAKAFIAGGYDALIDDDKNNININDRDDLNGAADLLANLNKLSTNIG